MDQRGLGQSSPPPPGFAWTPQQLARDVAAFMDAIGLREAHVVGAKIGGTVAAQFAVDYPSRVRTLTLVTAPVRKAAPGETPADAGLAILESGTRVWAESSQRARLGSVSEGMIAWWNDLMASSDAAACAGYAGMMSRLDNYRTLGGIQAPTLVLAVTRDGMPGEALTEWSRQIPNSELCVLPGDGYHLAATDPDECAERVLEFIMRPNGDRREQRDV
jgi:pimeloyl-ACP methyl ester carboxylesterase